MLILSTTPNAAPVSTAMLSVPDDRADSAHVNGVGVPGSAIAIKGTAAKAAFSAMLTAIRANAVRPAANPALDGSASGTVANGNHAAAGLDPRAETGGASKGPRGAPDLPATDAASLLAMLGNVTDTGGSGPDRLADLPAAQALPARSDTPAIIQTPAVAALVATDAAPTLGDANDGGDAMQVSREGTRSFAPSRSLAFDNLPAAPGPGPSTPRSAGVHARGADAARAAQAAATALPPAAASATAESASTRNPASEGGTPPASAQTGANPAPATTVPASVPGVMWSAPPGASASAAPVAVIIATPVHSPYFAQDAAQQVTWLTTHGIEQARIQVTPADLGPIEIRIAVENGEAMINFAVTHPESAAAITDALPRLREMLAAGGITLGQTSVGDEHSTFESAFGSGNGGREQTGRRGSDSAFAPRDVSAVPEANRSGPAPQRSGTRLVDLFA